MADVDTMGDDWLSEVEAAPEEAVVEAVAAEPVELSEPEAEVAEAVVEPESPQVPLGALKEERQKRQELERRLAALEAGQSRPVQPVNAQAPVQAPDPYEDPVGYNAYVQQTVQETEWRMRAEMSGRFAEQMHGREKVEAAVAWAQEQGAKDPTLGQRVQSQSDPVGFVVQEYERSRTLQTLGAKTPEEFAREYAVSQGWIVSEPGAAAPILKPSSPMPPKGLASAPGKGGVGQAPTGADWSEVKFALG